MDVTEQEVGHPLRVVEEGGRWLFRWGSPGRLHAAGRVTRAPGRGRKILRADQVTQERLYSQGGSGRQEP